MASSKPNSLPATTARPTREQRCCQNAKGENLSSFHFPLWNPLLWKVRAQVRNWRRDTHAMTILRTRCTLDNSAFGISYASSASILARRAWKKNIEARMEWKISKGSFVSVALLLSGCVADRAARKGVNWTLAFFGRIEKRRIEARGVQCQSLNFMHAWASNQYLNSHRVSPGKLEEKDNKSVDAWRCRSDAFYATWSRINIDFECEHTHIQFQTVSGLLRKVVWTLAHENKVWILRNHSHGNLHKPIIAFVKENG